MIVVDIETSGIDFNKCGIWQIGAIDLESREEFIDECRIDDEDEMINIPGAEKTVQEITGKTEQELRDSKKQSQKQLIIKFFQWFKNSKIKNIICQNPQFDWTFLRIKSLKYNIEFPIHYRCFDLHSIAQIIYKNIHGNFLIDKEKSDMDLSKTLRFCGMQDERKEHNALEDAKLEAECFSRLVYHKELFPEFSKFPIPDYLKNKEAK